jgi:tripartite-type tricarboxylate transporter receptor subunit TctC
VVDGLAMARGVVGMSVYSPGVGTSPHLAGELFKRRAGIEMTHVLALFGRREMSDMSPQSGPKWTFDQLALT